MKYLIPCLILSASLFGQETYLYASVSGQIQSATGIPFLPTEWAGWQIGFGRRSFFKQHAWDLSGGMAISPHTHSGYGQTSYLFYPRGESNGPYLGLGLGLDGGTSHDIRYVDGMIPLTGGYDFKYGFVQAQVQPILFSTLESHYPGSSRAATITYGYKF